MNNKVMSILFGNLDRETRHYICRRMSFPERKDWPTAKQKKEVIEAKQNIGKPIKQKRR